jgi:hypothetical protein
MRLVRANESCITHDLAATYPGLTGHTPSIGGKVTGAWFSGL